MGKQKDIHHRLGNVGVKMRQVLREFVNVLRQKLIGILQSVVEIRDLVKSDAIQILIMGVLQVRIK